MSLPSFSRFPFNKVSLNDVTPFTYRDGYTFAQKLEKLWDGIIEIQDSELIQNNAIAGVLSDIGITIQELLAQLIGYTISVTDDKYTASMMDGSTFSAYTVQGVNNLLETLDTDLREVVRLANAANASALASALVTMRGEVAALQTTTAAALATMRADITANNAANAVLLSKKVDKTLITNVRDHGVIGDGVADDTVALQNAINIAGIAGHLYFPKGTYKITASLRPMRQQRWEGTSGSLGYNQNDAQTMISATHDGVAIVAEYGCFFANLRISGPGSQFANSIGISANNVDYSAAHISIYNFAKGIYATKAWYAYLDRVKFYKNALAVELDYCYNFTLQNPHIMCDIGTGAWGNGIRLTGKSMLTIHGGSIEQYRTGIWMDSQTTLAMFGVYAESAIPPGGFVGPACLVRMAPGARRNVMMTGCQIYVTTHSSVVENVDSLGGDSITSMGNKFLGGSAGDAGYIFRYPDTPQLAQKMRLTLLGDSLSTLGWSYRMGGTIPHGSIIADPNGAGIDPARGGDMSTVFGGYLYSGKQGAVIPGSGSSAIPMDGAGYRDTTGGMMYRTDLKKPVWWDGTVWRDAASVIVT